ncbi:MBL fold metallo-hydrolase [Arthrobacter koreensis]|uniref:MBL fold metallo-hydrolase n=1 Tax=Arthrobacter koreensis TaxID=199136 RepID=UPI002DB64465|nr:MBL fold metallo-hydrolase [Arthrobacter koreensis]MEB7504897.1 MBL fold metallo-hydrolase [Arthrobacter koreensis]
MAQESSSGNNRLPVEEVVREMSIPAGLAGPEPVISDVRCYAVAQPGGIVLIDTGMPDAFDAIAEAVDALGGTFADVRDIVLTHLHMDHVGSLFAVAEQAPLASIYAGGADSPDIRSPRKIHTLEEGDSVQDLQILATPGHTSGHVSVFHEGTGSLFIGDAAATSHGDVVRSPAAFTSDAARAEESLERIAALSPERMLFAHGGEASSPTASLVRLVGGPYGG